MAYLKIVWLMWGFLGTIMGVCVRYIIILHRIKKKNPRNNFNLAVKSMLLKIIMAKLMINLFGILEQYGPILLPKENMLLRMP